MSASPRPYVPAVGPRLRQLLRAVLALFALLAVNSVYLGGITLLEWTTQRLHQNSVYQWMFALHLLLGLLLLLPVLVFGVLHGAVARRRPNRRAVRAGVALFTTALALLASGVVLTRFDFFEIKHPGVRGVAYWVHVVTPLVVAWLFVLHRLAGPRIRWHVGTTWAGVALALALAAVGLHTSERRSPRDPAGAERFLPSLAKTADGAPIPAEALMQDEYCRACHADIHEGWSHSVHRFASFNNPAYRFSVNETRRVVLERDGDVAASRFCAGCHDPVPLFSGLFDDPGFDAEHPTAQAGITCSACHAITRIDSVRGNADYTIEAPVHYPFATSENAALLWVNHQLIKARPAFHKQTFLKPLHREAEFCGTCHKVHLPPELNHYKWLRGQNHYDSFLLSGVSGHGVASFYYPPRAVDRCAGCHMPLRASDDFGARDFDASGALQVHDHLFAAANTAIPHLLGLPESVNAAHRAFLEGSVRLDLFGLRDGGTIDGALRAPLGPELPALEPGRSYLVETVIRTLELGHEFTQGTADSNEVWLELRARSGDRVLGHSGALDAAGSVDPWSYFVNAYVLDREGRRIDRRNAQDIFVALYDHQIPPGASSVVHHRLDVPKDVGAPVEIEAALRYRKFDTTYLRLFREDPDAVNDLPITTIATARVVLPVSAGGGGPEPAGGGNGAAPPIPAWERWNDYGIALLREGRTGELRQAEEAFARVEALGRAEGPLHLARVYLREGRLDDAVAALRRAAAHDPPAAPWSVAWFTALVNQQNGYLDEAIATLQALADTRFEEARRRGFDFSRDYRLWNELGKALFERAKQGRAGADETPWLREARDAFERALVLDPENVTAHYNLALIHAQLLDSDAATRHRALHARYKPDDNARDRAVAIHRRANPAADRAAEAIVIYELSARD